jgi:rhodanese-related sulfurtransferase
MTHQSVRRVLLLALLTIVLAGLSACGPSTEGQMSDGASQLTDALENDTSSEENEPFDVSVAEIPPENLISPSDLQSLMEDESCMTYDTRTALEYAEGSVPGAANLPLRFVEREQAVIPRDEAVAFLATDEQELLQLYGLLLDLGLDPANIRMLDGGITAWENAGFELEESEPHPCQ